MFACAVDQSTITHESYVFCCACAVRACKPAVEMPSFETNYGISIGYPLDPTRALVDPNEKCRDCIDLYKPIPEADTEP